MALLTAQVADALVNDMVWSVDVPFPVVIVAEPQPAEVQPVISDTDTSPVAIVDKSKQIC